MRYGRVQSFAPRTARRRFAPGRSRFRSRPARPARATDRFRARGGDSRQARRCPRTELRPAHIRPRPAPSRRPPQHRAGCTATGRTTLVDALGPIAEAKIGSVGQAEPLRIALGIGERRSDASMPSPIALGHSSSAASSRVPGPVPRSRIRRRPGGSREMLDRGGDQRFAVGPRDQRARPDLQVDRPKGAMAGDIGDRLALGPPLDEIEERVGRLALGIVEDQPVARRCPGRRPSAARHQAAACRWFSQLLGRPRQGAGNGGHASSRPASRSASSSATSASVSSARPGPSRIASSLCSVRLMRWSVTRPCGKL